MDPRTEELLKKYPTFDLSGLLNLMALTRDESAALSLTEVRDVLSRGQIVSKLWLIDELLPRVRERVRSPLSILICGGWVGNMANLFFQHMPREIRIAHIESMDIDPRCMRIAQMLNERFVHERAFRAFTADMQSYDYLSGGHNLIVNTSTEHLHDPSAWFSQLPRGVLAAVQSNNYAALSEHVSAVQSIEEFKAQCPFSEILFAGEMRLLSYTRYMLIGIV